MTPSSLTSGVPLHSIWGRATFSEVCCNNQTINTRQMTLLVAQLVKNLPAMPETWVGSLGQKDPLEKGMATHSSILVWIIP